MNCYLCGKALIPGDEVFAADPLCPQEDYEYVCKECLQHHVLLAETIYRTVEYNYLDEPQKGDSVLVLASHLTKDPVNKRFNDGLDTKGKITEIVDKNAHIIKGTWGNYILDPTKDYYIVYGDIEI
jgi:hypothetical protein